jgi:hypothetical protein
MGKVAEAIKIRRIANTMNPYQIQAPFPKDVT